MNPEADSQVLSAADRVCVEFAALNYWVIPFVPAELRDAIRKLMDAFEARQDYNGPTTQTAQKE